MNPNSIGENDLRWRKSTHSGTNGGDCVEVADTPQSVHVRDTKNRQGPALHLSPAAWRTFLDAVGL